MIRQVISIVWIKCRETFFILKCTCLGASKYLNLYLKLRFPAIYSMQGFLPIRLNHSGLSGDARTSKFLSYNFS